MRVNVYNDQARRIWGIECSRYSLWEGNTAISFFDAEGRLMSIYKPKDGDYITFKEFVDNTDSVA